MGRSVWIVESEAVTLPGWIPPYGVTRPDIPQLTGRRDAASNRAPRFDVADLTSVTRIRRIVGGNRRVDPCVAHDAADIVTGRDRPLNSADAHDTIH
jgi:hypothetical protein